MLSRSLTFHLLFFNPCRPRALRRAPSDDEDDDFDRSAYDQVRELNASSVGLQNIKVIRGQKGLFLFKKT